jgi:ABC-type sugar transport system substrate-binding protein
MKILFFILFLILNIYAKSYKVGFAQDTLLNDWRKAQVLDVQQEIDKYPFLQLTVKDANAQLSKQIEDIEYFINNKYDFIITSPINAKITSLVLKKAIEKGIKVILIDRGIEEEHYTSFISPDNYKIAQNAANYLTKKLNYQGTILMLEGVKGATPTILRTKGFMEVINKHKGIKIIKRRANYLRSDAIKVADKLFQDKVKFDAIYSQSDSMLSGVRFAMKKNNIKKSFITVGIDYISEAKSAIKNKTQDVSYTYDTCGKEGVQTIIKIINNQKIQKNYTLKSTMVTIKNVNDIKAIF